VAEPVAVGDQLLMVEGVLGVQGAAQVQQGGLAVSGERGVAVLPGALGFLLLPREVVPHAVHQRVDVVTGGGEHRHDAPPTVAPAALHALLNPHLEGLGSWAQHWGAELAGVQVCLASCGVLGRGAHQGGPHQQQQRGARLHLNFEGRS